MKAKLRAMSVELEGKARTIKQLVAQNRKLKTQVEQTASTASVNMKVTTAAHKQTQSPLHVGLLVNVQSVSASPDTAADLSCCARGVYPHTHRVLWRRPRRRVMQ